MLDEESFFTCHHGFGFGGIIFLCSLLEFAAPNQIAVRLMPLDWNDARPHTNQGE